MESSAGQLGTFLVADENKECLLNRLPDEVIFSIIRELSLDGRKTLTTVCKRFSHLACDAQSGLIELAIPFADQEEIEDPSLLPSVKRWGSAIGSVSIHMGYFLNYISSIEMKSTHDIMAALHQLEKVKSVSVYGEFVSQNKNLKEWIGSWVRLLRCKDLSMFQQGDTGSESDEEDQENIGSTFVSHAWNECPQLESLTLSGFEVAKTRLRKENENLTSLTVHKTYDVWENLEELIQKAPKLQKLALVQLSVIAANSARVLDMRVVTRPICKTIREIHLHFNRFFYGQCDLAGFAECENLEKLVFKGDKHFKCTKLPVIPKLKDGQFCGLEGDLSSLAECTNLEVFFWESGVMQGGIPDLKSERLRFVTIDTKDSSLSGKDVGSFEFLGRSAKTLRVLAFKGVANIPTHVISNLKSLTHLQIFSTAVKSDFIALSNHPKLRVLGLHSVTGISNLGPAPSHPFHSLREAVLVECPDLESADPIVNCRHHRKLAVGGPTKIGDVSYFSHHPSIRELGVQDLPNLDIMPFATCPFLTPDACTGYGSSIGQVAVFKEALKKRSRSNTVKKGA